MRVRLNMAHMRSVASKERIGAGGMHSIVAADVDNINGVWTFGSCRSHDQTARFVDDGRLGHGRVMRVLEPRKVCHDRGGSGDSDGRRGGEMEGTMDAGGDSALAVPLRRDLGLGTIKIIRVAAGPWHTMSLCR